MDDIQTALSFVVRTTAVGGHDLSDMHKAIPNLVVLVDHQHDAMANFLNAMNYTNGPCVHLEDDVILCDDFYAKITAIIADHPDDVIQFFSMRKDDVTIGTRYIAGSQFMMNQCFYLPAGLGPKIAEAWKTSARQNEAGAPYDLLMADYFKAHKMKYLNWCPNLVDHEVCVSRIDKRRSSKRQSLTFVK
jgi:GR25 family glycosyltransferase involved in LPS biosynthesis